MTEPQPKRWRFPILRAVGRFAKKAWTNWRLRHQDPRNFAIHMVGIPLAVAGLVFLFFSWRLGLAGLILGYLLQWIGHRWEGNDVGEWAAIKRLLGLPTVAISPRFTTSLPAPPADTGIEQGSQPASSATSENPANLPQSDSR